MSRDEVWRRLNSQSGLLLVVAILGYASYVWARDGRWWLFAASVAGTALCAFLAATGFRDYKPALHIALEGGEPHKARVFATSAIVIAIWVATFAAYVFHATSWGWLDRGDIIGGHQWYRLLTSIFIHAGMIHAAFNVGALAALGGAYEIQYGWRRMLVVFAASALGAEVLVLATTAQPVVGASGAIYGFIGAALYQAWTDVRAGHARSGAKDLRISAIVLVVNLLLTLSLPFISLAAHVGGLITGLLVAAMLAVPDGVRRAAAWNERTFPEGGYVYDHPTKAIGFRGTVEAGLASGFLAPADVVSPIEANAFTFMRADEALPESGVVFYKPLGEMMSP